MRYATRASWLVVTAPYQSMHVVVLHAYTQCPLPAAQLIHIMPAGQHITNMYTQLVIHHSEREHAQRQHYD